MNEERDTLLVSRAVGGDATPAEWDELSARADEHPVLWRRLGLTLRDETGFARALESAAAVAGTIDPFAAVDREHAPPPTVRRPEVGRWSGWALAAVIALAWLVSMLNPPAPPDAAPQLAEVLPLAPASDLLEAYLARGRQDDTVIGEVPEKILVDSRSSPTGEGYELLYLRQILERAVVPDLYRFTGEDELGRPVLVRFEQPDRGPM